MIRKPREEKIGKKKAKGTVAPTYTESTFISGLENSASLFNMRINFGIENIIEVIEFYVPSITLKTVQNNCLKLIQF